jgi:hypothetical protein
MASRIRKGPLTTITVDIEDEGLQKVLEALKPAARRKYINAATKKTLTSVKALTISAAKAQGFAKTGEASNNGWDWTRRGRLPNAITVGKVWNQTGQTGGRVYTKTAKTAGEMGRSPQANAFITGYDQYVPTGLPGKGQVRFTKHQPARPVYKLVEPMVRRIFIDNIQRSLRTAIKMGRI